MSAGELVDIVDENDCVTGSVTRSEMRRQRLLHRCVYILLFDSSGRMFVHRRTDTKDVYPGFWDVTVGGVVGAGEAYAVAARREVEEEVGLTNPRLTLLFPMSYEDHDTRVLGMVYECVSDQPLCLQVEEIAEGRWVRSDDLTALIERERICPDALAVLRSYASFRSSSKGRV